MKVSDKNRLREEEEIERIFRAAFSAYSRRFPPRAYRQNIASIRVRLVSNEFEGLTLSEREKIVLPIVRMLSEDIQDQLTMLLLLTPSEVAKSFANLEFERPIPSEL